MSATVFFLCTMTEENLDALLKSVDSLKQEHAEAQRDLRKRLEHLEKEVVTGQENVTQRVVKRLEEDRTLVFRKNGNECKFIFNDNVKDQLDAVGRQLDQFEPSSMVQKELLEKAEEELTKGVMLIAARQKRIKIADRSEFGWGTVDEYEEEELASNNEDEKRLEKADKAASAKAAKKRKVVPQRGYTHRNQPQQQRPQDHTLLPARSLTPAPGPTGALPPLPPGRPPRMSGPCFNYLEMGHLQASFPKLPRQYPLSSVINSVSVKLCEKNMASKEKVENHNGIEAYSDNCPCMTGKPPD